MQHNSCEREGSKEEKHERSNPAETPRSVKKEVGGGVLGMGADIPLQPMEKVMVKEVVLLLEPMEVHSGADPPCSPWRIPCQRKWLCPEESCRLLAETAACGEKPTQKLVLWQELQLVGDPWWNSLFKHRTLWGQPDWSSL